MNIFLFFSLLYFVSFALSKCVDDCMGFAGFEKGDFFDGLSG